MACNPNKPEVIVLPAELRAWYDLVCPRRRRKRRIEWYTLKASYLAYLESQHGKPQPSIPDSLFGFPVGGIIQLDTEQLNFPSIPRSGEYLP